MMDLSTYQTFSNLFNDKIDFFILTKLAEYRNGLQLNKQTRKQILKLCRQVIESLKTNLPLDITNNVVASTNQNLLIFISIYQNNFILACGYKQGKTFFDSVVQSAIHVFNLAKTKISTLPSNIHLEINLLFDEKNIIFSDLKQNEINFGLDSLCLTYQKNVSIFKNSVSIRNGFTLDETINKLKNKIQKTLLVVDEMDENKIALSRFKTIEFREDYNSKNKFSLYDLFRGGPLILQSEVTNKNLENSINLACTAFRRFINSNLDVAYEYSFSKKQLIYSETPEAVLRKIASIWVLADLSIYKRKQRYVCLSKKVIKLFINKYYIERNNLGFLCINGIVDIGNAGVLLLAINAIKDFSFLSNERSKLISFIFDSFDYQGKKFRTFLSHKITINTHESELYLPLIALNALLSNCSSHKDQSIEVAERSFTYYKDLFCDADNKFKMLMWMTSAYTKLYFLTKNTKYSDFIFYANDTVLDYQVKNEAINLDLIGSFFSKYGSTRTTAVITESLIDAFRVSIDCGDEKRSKSYFEAIILALRFILQTQITKDNKLDAIQVGAFKNTIFDANLRIDTLQHASNAILKFLLLDKQD